MDEAFDDLLNEFPDVTLGADGYERAGAAFAARSADGAVDIKLGDEIAEAATHTPDTTASSRGPGWVHFAPQEWDNHALDRLDAWFRVAWRLAETSRS